MSTISFFIPNKNQCSLVTDDNDIISRFISTNFDNKAIKFVDEPSNADIILLFEQYSFKQKDYVEKLLKNSLFINYFKKIYTINYDDVGQGFLPGCYTSLTKRNFNPLFHRACSYPKTYNQEIIEYLSNTTDQETSKFQYLYSFRGTLLSHKCRLVINQLVNQVKYHNEEYKTKIIINNQVFHKHSITEKKDYVDDIVNSSFVLCPRGFSPSTYRLFEVMQLSRCPVIISDDWVEIDSIPWQECSIRIKEKDFININNILKSRLKDSTSLGKRASKIWHENFSNESKNKFYLDKVIELHTNLNNSKDQFKNVAEYKKYWNSWSFNYNNGWTFPQKLIRLLKRISGLK